MKKKTLLLLCAILYTVMATAQWNLTGNAGTSAVTNFLGTTDLKPLRLRVNNTWAGQIHPLSGNIAIGLRSAINDSSSYSNIAIGTDALRSNTAKSNLVAIGDSALFNNVSGFSNIAIGSKALYTTTGGFENTAIGYHSLYSDQSGDDNTAVGAYTLQASTSGHNNTALGIYALASNTTASGNTAIGAVAMNYNTSGTYNVAVGPYALLGNRSGSFNVGIGYLALGQTTTAQYNTTIGAFAGYRYDLGYNNTILGANCDAAFSGCYNDISIGQGVACTDNSMARIGNSATWSIGGAVNWTKVSDGRFKKDIRENVMGLDFIMKLRPVTYHLDATGLSKRLQENQGKEWNAQMKTAFADKEKIWETGFIAQEVEQAAAATSFTFSGIEKPRTDSGLYGLRYADFVVPLVKAMQEQQKMIISQQQALDSMRLQMQSLQNQADIAILLRESFAADKLNAYPDPVASTMTVTIQTQATGNGYLKIFDSAGKLVQQTTISVQQGANTFNVSLPTLAAGYYTLSMDWGKGMHKQIRFVKGH